MTTRPSEAKAFGATVERLRSEARLSRIELANTAGISYSYLSAIETGARLPSGAVQEALARALSTSTDGLIRAANDVTLGVEAPPQPSIAAAMAARELEGLVYRMSGEDREALLQVARRLADEPSDIVSGPVGAPIDRDRPALYHRFWSRYLEALDSLGHDWATRREATSQSSFTLSSHYTGFTLVASFARSNRLRHELYIDFGDEATNESYLSSLRQHLAVIERSYGRTLTIEPPTDRRRAIRVADYRVGSILWQDEWHEYIDWFIDSGSRARAMVNDPELIELVWADVW